jgi:hypothetical protein
MLLRLVVSQGVHLFPPGNAPAFRARVVGKVADKNNETANSDHVTGTTSVLASLSFPFTSNVKESSEPRPDAALPRRLSGQRFTLSHDRSVSIKENVRQALFDQSDTVNTIMFVCKQSRNWNRSRLMDLRDMATCLPSVHFLKINSMKKKAH